MIYQLSKAPELHEALFRNPPAAFRGAPFWAWNDLLTKEELARQIEVFKEMGLGGFHMHVRTGLQNPYMDEDFLELVKSCVEKAKQEGMLAYLYDEDRWPSGAAGGTVTKDERYRARSLLFTNALKGEAHANGDSCSDGGRSNNGRLLACYDVGLDEDGYLTGYRRIAPEEDALGEKWYAILEVHQPSEWYNDQTYVDTLNPDAIRRFVEETHEKYLQKLGAERAVFIDLLRFFGGLHPLPQKGGKLGVEAFAEKGRVQQRDAQALFGLLPLGHAGAEELIAPARQEGVQESLPVYRPGGTGRRGHGKGSYTVRQGLNRIRRAEHFLRIGPAKQRGRGRCAAQEHKGAAHRDQQSKQPAEPSFGSFHKYFLLRQSLSEKQRNAQAA